MGINNSSKSKFLSLHTILLSRFKTIIGRCFNKKNQRSKKDIGVLLNRLFRNSSESSSWKNREKQLKIVFIRGYFFILKCLSLFHLTIILLIFNYWITFILLPFYKNIYSFGLFSNKFHDYANYLFVSFFSSTKTIVTMSVSLSFPLFLSPFCPTHIFNSMDSQVLKILPSHSPS